ncbi:SGNH/GDSL hydrolase family protein [Vibrio navarrensis]
MHFGKKITLPLLFASTCVHAYSDVVFFGDSLSDTGNLFSVINGLLGTNIHMMSPPSADQGHAFSNNKLISDYISNHYGFDLQPAWKIANQAENPLGLLENSAIYKLLNSNGINESNYDIIDMDSLFVLKKLGKELQEGKIEFSGNNYAVANSTVLEYENTIDKLLYNRFNLKKQLDGYFANTQKKPIEKTIFFLITSNNDIMRLYNKPTVLDDLSVVSKELANQVNRLVNYGAKKVIVIGPADISSTPNYHYSLDAKKIREAVVYLQELLAIRMTVFDPKQVQFIEIVKEMHSIAESHYSEDKRNLACLSNVANGYVNIKNLLFRGELSSRYINGCNLESLDNGDFFYFDYFHPTDKVNRLMSEYIINKIY